MTKMERVMGIEPTTYSLGSCRSTTELHPHIRDLMALEPESVSFLSPKAYSSKRDSLYVRRMTAARAVTTARSSLFRRWEQRLQDVKPPASTCAAVNRLPVMCLP